MFDRHVHVYIKLHLRFLNYFDYNKEEFGELVLLMLDRKILKHFEAEDSLQPSPTSTLSIQDTFGLTSEEMEAMEKFKKHLSSLKEQLEMTDSDREKYTKYLNSLSEEDTKHFSSAMRKIGSSKKQSVFRNWLGFDEPEETLTVVDLEVLKPHVTLCVPFLSGPEI